MRLPRTKTETQLRLFHEPLGNHGHIRTLLGDFCEALTARLFHGVRYRTDSRCDYCPDVSCLNGDEPEYFEVKAVGKTNRTFVYEGRLQKDLKFASDHKLFYVLWHHQTKTSVCRDEFELRSWFLASLKAIYLLDFASFYEIAIEQPLTKLNSKYGHSDSNETYGAGRRIPISKIITKNPAIIEIAKPEGLF